MHSKALESAPRGVGKLEGNYRLKPLARGGRFPPSSVVVEGG